MLAPSELSCPVSVEICQLVSVCWVGTLVLLSDGFEIKKKKAEFCLGCYMVFWVWKGLCPWDSEDFFELPGRKDQAMMTWMGQESTLSQFPLCGSSKGNLPSELDSC